MYRRILSKQQSQCTLRVPRYLCAVRSCLCVLAVVASPGCPPLPGRPAGLLNREKVIKSRLQQRGTAEQVHAGSSRYRGTLHCAAEIGRKEGPRGFFKGCLAHAVRAAPASAITFVVYEEVVKALV